MGEQATCGLGLFGQQVLDTVRVLLAHNNYTVTGGAEVFYHEIGRLLAENGHEVAWFSGQEEGLEAPFAEYFPPTSDYRNVGVAKRAAGFPSMVYNRKAKAAMARLIADFKPDVIHAFAIYVRLTPAILDAAREAGVPVVLSSNDYKLICPNYKLFHHGRICEECKGGKFHRAIANRCCHDSTAFSVASSLEAYAHQYMDIWRKNVDCFLFASEFMAKKTQEFWGADTFRYEMLCNPFDAAGKFHLEGPVGDYALFFGRLIDEKGVNVLLDAAERTPDVPLVVIGDGPDRAEVEARVADHPHIRFLGPKWGDELNEWLANARFVVIPSLWHENFPYVIFQAFAAGKPVLGTNRGGIPELVKDGERGWIYEATDVDALSGALSAAAGLEDAQLTQMGAAARAHVEAEFSDPVIYKRLIEIYESVRR